MTGQEVLATLRTVFKDDILDVFEKSSRRVYISITPQSITKIARYILKEAGARFNSASGVDARQHIEILYHFTLDRFDCIISFRVNLAKDHLEIDALTPLFKGADWIEREMHEMLGITFKGHPNLKRLLLPDEWPQGVYPLRTDYKEWDKGAIRDRGV